MTYEEVSDALTNLAEKENSLIAKTITETDDSGRTTTSYDVFGKGELPQGLVKADRLVASQANLAENYYVVKGNLDIKVVENVLQLLGLVDSYIYRPTLLNSLSLFLGRGAPSLGFIIFILTNLALTVVGQIVYLRSAGIEMLSGVRSWQIASRFLRVDGRDIALATGGALVFGLIAILILGWPMVYYRFVAIGIAFYACLLFFLSLSTSIGFMIALNISQLQKLIKGALPLKAIFAILLVGQCLAVCIISIGASRTLTYVGVLHTLTIGEKAWQERQHYNTLRKNVQLEILMTLSPTILGIFTSILLFNTMNLLYFETFKRKIAIKRIAGMGFIELHGSYLGEQVGSALIGMGLAMFMTKSVIVSLGVVVALLINSWMLLNNQAKREEKIQLSVLNGR